MSRCLVLFCPNKGMIPGVSYFTLTKTRYESWMLAIGRDPKDGLSSSNRICSDHFLEEDKIVTEYGKISVKKGAVPKLYLKYRKSTSRGDVKSCRRSMSVPRIPAVENRRRACKMKGKFLNSITHRKVLLAKAVPASSNHHFRAETITSNLEVKNRHDVEESTLMNSSNTRAAHIINVAGPSKEISVADVFNEIRDFGSEDFEMPSKAKRTLEFLKRTVAEQRKNVELLKVEKNTLENRIRKVKEVMIAISFKTSQSKKSFSDEFYSYLIG